MQIFHGFDTKISTNFAVQCGEICRFILLLVFGSPRKQIIYTKFSIRNGGNLNSDNLLQTLLETDTHSIPCRPNLRHPLACGYYCRLFVYFTD